MKKLNENTLPGKIFEVLKTINEPLTGQQLCELLDTENSHISPALTALTRRNITSREMRKVGDDMPRYYYWLGARPKNMPGEFYETKSKTKKKPRAAPTPQHNPAQTSMQDFMEICKKYFAKQTLTQLIDSGLDESEVMTLYHFMRT